MCLIPVDTAGSSVTGKDADSLTAGWNYGRVREVRLMALAQAMSLLQGIIIFCGIRHTGTDHGSI